MATQGQTKTNRGKKIESRQMSAYSKLAALLFSGIIILMADAYFSTRDKSPHQPPVPTPKISQAPIDREAVLGEFEERKQQVQAIIEDNLSFLQQRAPTVGQEVGETAQKLIDDNAENIQTQVGENVESIVNENAIKPLVKQIENLSESQQKTIREVICAAPTPTPLR